jgi:hypothetical protein
MSYKVITRKQFTFIVSDKNLACILTANIKKTADSVIVNVVGLFIQKIESGDNFVTITVGPADPNAPSNPTYEEQLQQFRENLDSLKIKYHEGQVLQIFNIEAVTGTPGTIRIPIVALICAGIPIRNSYIGEPVPTNVISLFIEVPKRYIVGALGIIRNINVKNPEKDLCINVKNYEKKCLCKKSCGS